MTITAAQIREARRLLRRSSATLAMKAGVGFEVILKAQLDAEIGSISSDALRVIEQSLVRSGMRFTADGGVSLQKTKPLSSPSADPNRSPDV
jgi:hypothetical protein